MNDRSSSRQYKALSALLCYPSIELQEAIPAIRSYLGETVVLANLESLLLGLAQGDLIDLQEQYVLTFDRNPAHSLHLFEHVHGEDRARGQAMVDLMEEYRNYGFDVITDELPDYVPLFLEFLSTCQEDKAQVLLGDAIHVLAHIGKKLSTNQSMYAPIFDALIALSPVVPEPLTVPPIRDMDEALESFGPNVEGVEPLLNRSQKLVAPIHFYPERPQQYAMSQ